MYIVHDRKIYYEVKPENVMRLWRDKNRAGLGFANPYYTNLANLL